MAVAQGYGKTATSGSVFAYDVADTRNSYIGKPGYNVTGTPVAWVGNQNTSDFKTTVGTTTVNIPAIGTREVQYVDIWNTGASNCCPSLWRYGNWGITTGVSGNTLYTYSIIYKTKSGYTHPNFMYRYEFNGGSYITEVGVFDTAKRIDLGDGWYQAYNTFTTNASTNTLYLGMWYYQYNVYDTVYLYKASLTQGNHVFSPEQIIPPSTTRSNTQGLLPLVGNSTIDLSNVSFDSNAQITFDGTNDYVNLVDFNIFNGTLPFSVELIFSITAFNGSCILVSFFGENLLMYTFGDGLANEVLGFRGYINSTWATPVYTPSLSTGKYYYVNTTYSPTSGFKLYLDGVNISSNSLVGSIASYTLQNSIGSLGNNTRFFNGQVPVMKIYNRALSAAEVKQNYLHYKTRFNLP